MAKADCAKFDLELAEYALYLAQDTKLKTVDQIATHINKEFDVDTVTPNIVANAIRTYTQASTKKQQDAIAQNINSIKEQSKGIVTKTQGIDRIAKENQTGTYTKPNARTERVMGETETALRDMEKQVRKSKMDAQKKKTILADIHSLRNDIRSGQLRVKPTKQTAQVDAELLKLIRTKRTLSTVMQHRLDAVNESKLYKKFRQAQGFFRNVGAAIDFPLGRQAKFAMGHPFTLSRSTWKALRGGLTEKQQNQIEAEWEKDPDYEEMVALKLIKPSEEEFEDFDVMNKLWGINVPFKWSARAQHILLTDLRIQLYKSSKWAYFDNNPTLTQQKEIARHVLVSTGIGQSKLLDQYGRDASQAMFAPKYRLSRIQLLTDLVRLIGKKGLRNDKQLLKMYAYEYSRTITAWLISTSLVLWAKGLTWDDFGTDPTSSDFLQIVDGHTRIDMSGGIKTWLVPLFQFAYGEKTSPITGKVRKLEGLDRLTPIGSWFRKGAAPLIADALNQMAGRENVIGESVDIGTAKGWAKQIGIASGLYRKKYGEKIDTGTEEGWENFIFGHSVPYSIGSLLDTMNENTPTGQKILDQIMNMSSHGVSVFDSPGEPTLREK